MLNQTLKSLYGGGSALIPYGVPLKSTKVHAEKLFKGFPLPFPTAVGIEVEIENAESGLVDQGLWRTEGDASLRNGMELISHPLVNDEVYWALAALDDFFSRNPGAKFSHRCSIHVHINAVTMTYEQLLVFLGLYLTVENLFFDAFFPHRKGNNYCFPLGNTQITQMELQRHRLTREVWKYAAVNCMPLRTFGTLEFRQHCGTKNVMQLLEWINTIMNIYTYAQNTKLDDFVNILYDLNTSSGYTEYVRKALPDWTVPISPDNMYDSVTAAKYFLSKKGPE